MRGRYLALVAVVLVAGVGTALAIRGGDGGKPTQCGESGGDSFRPITGLPLRDPPELRSQGGTLEVDLEVDEQSTTISGRRVGAKVYNGQFVGPTLRLQPGDTLVVNLENRLDEPTNLHFHGMHVSPEPPADDVIHTHVMPGQSFQYVVEIPADHNPGTFWYHSHQHGQAEEQVFGGLSGTIVVDGDESGLPDRLQNLPERVFALKDLQVEDGAIVDQDIDSDKPTHRTVNGLVQPRFESQVGRPELWRFANIGADIWYRIDTSRLEARVVNEDGNPVTAPRPSPDELVLPPGKRYDVIVLPTRVGTFELKTLQFSTGPDGDCYPEALLATGLVGAGPEPEPLPDRVAVDGPKPERVSGDPPIDNTFTFTEVEGGAFMINGKTFDPNRPPDVQVPLDATQNWRLVNKTRELHPFHLHIDDFTVLSINGTPYDATSQQDTVPLPVGGEVVIRTTFSDFEGEFVFHCHILAHEDAGMMATVLVQ